MKKTMYELLGLVKDGKAPKKIKYENREYYLYDNKSYLTTDKTRFFDRIYFSDLNIEVEILEEKKIPEKLEEFEIQYNLDYIDYKNIETLKKYLNKDFQTIYDTIDLIIKNQNQIIDYLKSKGE